MSFSFQQFRTGDRDIEGLETESEPEEGGEVLSVTEEVDLVTHSCFCL